MRAFMAAVLCAALMCSCVESGIIGPDRQAVELSGDLFQTGGTIWTPVGERDVRAHVTMQVWQNPCGEYRCGLFNEDLEEVAAISVVVGVYESVLVYDEGYANVPFIALGEIDEITVEFIFDLEAGEAQAFIKTDIRNWIKLKRVPIDSEAVYAFGVQR